MIKRQILLFYFGCFCWVFSCMASTSSLQEIAQQLQNIQTLQAKFIQKNPDGQILTGTFYLQKPGKMRFAYDGPADFMLLADGQWLIYHDLQMDEVAYLNLDKNPLAILLKNYPDINQIKDIQVNNIIKHHGKTALEIFYPKENTTIVLYFTSELILDGWVTHDPQGTIINVQLKNIVVNQPIKNAEKLFSFVRPKRKRIKRDRED